MINPLALCLLNTKFPYTTASEADTTHTVTRLILIFIHIDTCVVIIRRSVESIAACYGPALQKFGQMKKTLRITKFSILMWLCAFYLTILVRP